ncbi:MAG: SoxR reducing system RseC family protein [Granulosicoccus sp.]
MRRNARVISNAVASGQVLVEVEGVSACQRCAKGQGCGAGIFNHGIQAARIECHTPISLSENQQVEIEIDDSGSQWLWLVAGAYGLPLLGMFGFSLLTWLSVKDSSQPTLFNVSLTSDSLVAIAAFMGLSGGLIAWRGLSAYVLPRFETGLCMQSARIVSEKSSSGVTSK